MNTRKFLATVTALVVTPWQSLMATTRKVHAPLLTQVFPKTDDELPGLFIGFEGQVYPYQIVRAFDDQNDTWQGQQLNNNWRNKWWVKNVNGQEELALIDRRPIGEWGKHTWGFDPKILFFKRNT